MNFSDGYYNKWSIWVQLKNRLRVDTLFRHEEHSGKGRFFIRVEGHPCRFVSSKYSTNRVAQVGTPDPKTYANVIQRHLNECPL